MRKIITFLGSNLIKDRDGNLIKTDYDFGSEVRSGCVFPEALRSYIDFDSMLVFVTEVAEQNTWPYLRSLGDDRIRPISIPTGNSVDDMWELFSIILENVECEDTLIFDITQGLRSTPFLMFLFSAFLKFARKVKIEAVYYGAYEVGKREKQIPAPVYDLSPFVEMLDWLTAADSFITTGNGQVLTDLLRAKIPPDLPKVTNKQESVAYSKLLETAGTIDNISNALSLARPYEAMSSAALISETIPSDWIRLGERVRPFGVLITEIEHSYGQFGLAHPLKKRNVLQSLRNQLNMCEWYLSHQNALQAALLMREWIVSVLMAVNQQTPLNAKSKRETFESFLNDNLNTYNQTVAGKNPKYCTEISLLPDPTRLLVQWGKLTKLRNDFAHCGQREAADNIEQLIIDTKNIISELNKLKDALFQKLTSIEESLSSRGSSETTFDDVGPQD